MARTRDDALSHSMMILCLGTALLLLAGQWQRGSSPLQRQRSSAPQHPIMAPPPLRPTPSVPVLQPTVESTRRPLQPKPVRLVVDLSDRRVYLYRHNRRQASYPIAIGQNGWETPTGTFQVIQMKQNPTWKHPITGVIIPPSPQNPLGARWIGFWSDRQHLIGFHGTNQEDLVGQAVSHGCLRMRNPDIIALYSQVTLGTAVIINP